MACDHECLCEGWLEKLNHRAREIVASFPEHDLPLHLNPLLSWRGFHYEVTRDGVVGVFTVSLNLPRPYGQFHAVTTIGDAIPVCREYRPGEIYQVRYLNTSDEIPDEQLRRLLAPAYDALVEFSRRAIANDAVRAMTSKAIPTPVPSLTSQGALSAQQLTTQQLTQEY